MKTVGKEALLNDEKIDVEIFKQKPLNHNLGNGKSLFSFPLF